MEVAPGADSGDGGDSVRSSKQAPATGAGGSDRPRSNDNDIIGLFPVYVIKLSSVDPLHQSQPPSRDNDDETDHSRGGDIGGRSSPSPPLNGGGGLEEMVLVGGHTAKVLVTATSHTLRHSFSYPLNALFPLCRCWWLSGVQAVGGWQRPGSTAAYVSGTSLTHPHTRQTM